MEETYYFAGGLYYNNYNRPQDGTNFDIVSAGYEGALPYITKNARGLSLTSHHSSLYRLSEDFTEAFLVDHRNGGVISSPSHVKLSLELQAKVKQSIAKGEFYD